MEEGLELPKMLDMPPKLYPVVEEFNDWRFFLLEGGRGGGKSQFVARFLLYLAEQIPSLKVLCGREVQNKIEESVHSMLAEIIEEYDLPFEVLKTEIRHKLNGSVFKFRGFIDRGVTTARGIEGYDIIWIDEAQQLTKATVDDLIPSIIRKSKAKLFFTMNRFLYEDAIYEYMAGHKKCLHITLQYYDNPFINKDMIDEAEECRSKSQKDYDHIWLGQPLPAADDYLFNFKKLHRAFEIEPFGDAPSRQRILAIDFAAQGNDLCVATVLDRVSGQHWEMKEQITWDEADTTISVGKIINMIGEFKPTLTILDVGGGGHNVHCDLVAAKQHVFRFDGGSTLGVNKTLYANQRAEGYYTLKEWFEREFLVIPKKFNETVKQLEKIRMKFRNTGVRLIQPKPEMKKEVKYSPDHADSLMMAIYAATKYLGKPNSNLTHEAQQIKRITKSNRHKR